MEVPRTHHGAVPCTLANSAEAQMHTSCPQAQAKFLPKQFYKCKKPKPAAPSTDQQVPQVAVPSGDRNVGCVSMNKKTCEAEAGCVWCNCSIRPAKCYAEVSTWRLGHTVHSF